MSARNASHYKMIYFGLDPATYDGAVGMVFHYWYDGSTMHIVNVLYVFG